MESHQSIPIETSSNKSDCLPLRAREKSEGSGSATHISRDCFEATLTRTGSDSRNKTRRRSAAAVLKRKTTTEVWQATTQVRLGFSSKSQVYFYGSSTSRDVELLARPVAYKHLLPGCGLFRFYGKSLGFWLPGSEGGGGFVAFAPEGSSRLLLQIDPQKWFYGGNKSFQICSAICT